MSESLSQQPHFHPGQPIVIRELWQGKVWSARPSIVVQDTPELIACYISPGALWKTGRPPGAERITPAQRARVGWRLHDALWFDIRLLRLSIPDGKYSVLLFWDSKGSLSRWYINLEDPLQRTRLGFDEHDQILDVIIAPNLSTWHWEDEDELEEAVSAGLMSEEKAAALHAEGERVVGWLQSGKSPFNGWENWRPNLSWPVPVLPEGWDIV